MEGSLGVVDDTDRAHGIEDYLEWFPTAWHQNIP